MWKRLKKMVLNYYTLMLTLCEQNHTKIIGGYFPM